MSFHPYYMYQLVDQLYEKLSIQSWNLATLSFELPQLLTLAFYLSTNYTIQNH